MSDDNEMDGSMLEDGRDCSIKDFGEWIDQCKKTGINAVRISMFYVA